LVVESTVMIRRMQVSLVVVVVLVAVIVLVVEVHGGGGMADYALAVAMAARLSRWWGQQWRLPTKASLLMKGDRTLQKTVISWQPEEWLMET
jgi:hypothetical protein